MILFFNVATLTLNNQKNKLAVYSNNAKKKQCKKFINFFTKFQFQNKIRNYKILSIGLLYNQVY